MIRKEELEMLISFFMQHHIPNFKMTKNGDNIYVFSIVASKPDVGYDKLFSVVHDEIDDDFTVIDLDREDYLFRAGQSSDSSDEMLECSPALHALICSLIKHVFKRNEELRIEKEEALAAKKLEWIERQQKALRELESL